MALCRGLILVSLFGVFGVAGAAAQDPGEGSISNWSAPAAWTPTRAVGLHTLTNITSPLPFIGVTPCRVADTRGNGFTGAYGPPSLAANGTRSFTITGQCGIPASAEAVSFNFAALNVGAAGDLRVFPAGGAAPLVSTLNFSASTPTIANAAIVALGSGGAITAEADAVSIDLIIDVNGYYAGGVGNGNTFLGSSAGNFTMTGGDNTGIGLDAFHANVTGILATAIGYSALFSNTSGDYNTAVGGNALAFNTSGGGNTAIGASALQDNGVNSYNTAVGYAALEQSTGSENIGIGHFAGGAQQTGNHNIYIGNAGVNGESNTIRIGDASFQDGGTIITGISGLSSIGGAPVYVNGGGRLGTSTASSRRFKQEIRDIAGDSDRLMELRPVAFKYKPEFDPAGVLQYGLIAEEVAEVCPDLVTSDRDGRPEGVRYHLIAPLLLNEVQKQRRTIEAQEKTIARQRDSMDRAQAEIQDLKARMTRLETRLPAQ